MQSHVARPGGWLRLIGHRTLILAIVGVLLGGAVVGLARLGRVPATQAQVEGHLERAVLTYAVVDDVPYIVFPLNGRVVLDQLILDWISIEWPPTPRWQWTGMWDSIAPTTDPASLGYGTATLPPRIVYGQINDPAIVELHVRIEDATYSFPVSAPAYVVRLPTERPWAAEFRWVDAQGREIWSWGADA